MDYWDDYYTKNDPQNIPWTGANPKFLGKIWQTFKLPMKGNVLDIGCGRGDKSIFLAEKGFNVWGVDISEVAIKHANEASKHLKDKPIFVSGDISRFDEIKEFSDKNFDIVLDFSVSQFLSKEEKVEYLAQLSKHLIPNMSFYILLTFAKDDENDDQDGIADWIKKIAQTPKEVEELYGKNFEILDRWRSYSTKGKSDTYILKAK